MEKTKRTLVLASASPRRRELLAQAGLPHAVRPAQVEELRRKHEAPRDYVLRLAKEKALAVQCGREEVILAADTTVALDQNRVLEKPANVAEARAMLQALSGREHEVLTGVCLRWEGRLVTHVESTKVQFTALGDEDVDWYVATGEPFDKAGGYGIQGYASRFVTRVEGCFFNVVGLPVAQVCRLLREAGVLS